MKPRSTRPSFPRPRTVAMLNNWLRRWIVVIFLGSWLATPSRGDDFPNPPDTETNPGQPPSPEEALKLLRLPEGFRASVFAAEPEVRNPIGMAWDARGRLWIAENYTYAARAQKFDLKLRDRVLIFEDRDGDGKADSRKVFTDSVQRLSSVAIGHGGVWLLCPPQLLFVPDRDRDDIPDGPAEVVLDGFEVPPENYHGFANGLKWGPDGWLYGRCGASAPGELGVPGAPPADRVPVRGGLWRFQPTRKSVEALTHGTTNPWGHDWNALGEAFFINTVNGHLWHAVAGAHFVRPHTIDPNPYAYELIDQHADHWHWDNAKDWTDSRSASGEHDRRGGGHAHSGMLIYQGDNWPASYVGGLFTLNLHGRRVNFDALEREGSGYVGRHRPDPILAGDPWFRGLDLGTGPDGGVFVLDWSDTGECHEQTGVHRSSGRIYKITAGVPSRISAFDLERESSPKLLDRLDHPNDWFARQARVILSARAAAGDPLSGVREQLRERFGRTNEPAGALGSLWTWHAMGGVDGPLLRSLLRDPRESVRAWAVRFLTDDLPLDTVYGKRPGGRPDLGLPEEDLNRLVELARDDASGLVRLVLASTLQRLPHPQRQTLATPLLSHSEDAGDHNLPLMLWHALMPLAETDPSALAALGAHCALPTTRRLIARRLAEEIDRSPGALNTLLAAVTKSGDDPACLDLLAGLSEGLRGRRKASPPDGWEDLVRRVGSVAEARDRLRDLNVLFGDGRALEDVRRVALDEKAEISARRSALESLIVAEPPDLQSVCQSLLKVRFLNPTAARGLAKFDGPAVGRALASSYRAFHASERSVLFEVLVSRPAFAGALLDQMAAGAVPRADLSAFQARQLKSLGDSKLTRRLEEVWGALRDTDADRKATITELKRKLTPSSLAKADPSRGRVVFERACASCHALYGRGGDAGPDLTGAGRHDLDYLLENVIDPSAAVTADFRMTALALEDGRVLNGLVTARTDRAITLRTPTETVVLERARVEDERPTNASLMPDGLLSPLPDAEVSDLFAYLMTRTQVPLPSER